MTIESDQARLVAYEAQRARGSELVPLIETVSRLNRRQLIALALVWDDPRSHRLRKPFVGDISLFWGLASASLMRFGK